MALIIGILIYFALPVEPNGYALGTSLLIACLILFISKQSYFVFQFVLLITLIISGLCLAKWQNFSLRTPLIQKAGTYELSGYIIEIKIGIKHTQLTLDEAYAQQQFLSRVQLSIHNQNLGSVKVGDYVNLKARLQPLSGPILPGGYNFRRKGYFEGISARGFVLGKINAVKDAKSNNSRFGTILNTLSYKLENLRAQISKRLNQAITEQEGALASALLVGDRSRIDLQTQTALRQSGLAHILAISGLHMALVTSFVFFIIRTFMSVPILLHYYPVKKWAACVALVASTVYLGLSGASISAQRAFLMAAIFLLAVLFDRSAITMRNAALAACIVIFVHPAAILSPSFQMSFMAVIALIAAFKRRERNKNSVFKRTLLYKLLSYPVGVMLTALIAGMATMPYAIFHFYQMPVFGIIANLLAMPIIAFLVMPMGIIALSLMPFGLDNLPLQLMGWGIKNIIFVANWVSNLEDAVIYIGQQTATFIILVTFAILALCFLQTKLRFIMFGVLLISAFVINIGQDHPILLIAQEGRMIASFNQDKNDKEFDLQFHGQSRNNFTANIWLKAFADPRLPKEALANNREKDTCDRTGCIIELQSGNRRYVIAIINRIEAFFEACEFDVDIIISHLTLPHTCKDNSLNNQVFYTVLPVIIDQQVLNETGSLMLFTKRAGKDLASNQVSMISLYSKLEYKLDSLDLVVKTALPKYKRPWN